MKINYDCIRDILIALEKADCGVNDRYVDLDELNLYDKYGKEQLLFHLRHMDNAELISLDDLVFTNPQRKYIHKRAGTRIFEILPLGHELLERTRDDSFWQKFKTKIPDIAQSGLAAFLEAVISSTFS